MRGTSKRVRCPSSRPCSVCRSTLHVLTDEVVDVAGSFKRYYEPEFAPKTQVVLPHGLLVQEVGRLRKAAWFVFRQHRRSSAKPTARTSDGCAPAGGRAGGEERSSGDWSEAVMTR